MKTREEFQAALDQVEEALARLGLMVRCLRRIEGELWPPDAQPAPDFDYRTGMPPKDSGQT
jgi:hypothetical protein